MSNKFAVFGLVVLVSGSIASAIDLGNRRGFEKAQLAVDVLRPIAPKAPAVAASIVHLQNSAAALAGKTPPVWRTPGALLGHTDGGKWLIGGCVDTYVPARVNSKGEVRLTAMDKRGSDDIRFSFGGQEEALDDKYEWQTGKRSVQAESGQTHSAFRFVLKPDAWTAITIQGLDYEGEECVTTVRIVRDRNELTLSRIPEPKFVLEERLQTEQLTKKPSKLPLDAQAVRDILNANGGADGVQAITVQYPNGSVARVMPSYANGIADDFDGDCATTGNMCQQFAERACAVLNRLDIGCRKVWYWLPSGTRHAIIAAETQAGWQYVEPQLNRNFGYPDPNAPRTTGLVFVPGAIYQEWL